MNEDEFAIDKLHFLISLEDTLFNPRENENLIYTWDGKPYSKRRYRLANADGTNDAQVYYYQGENTIKVELNPTQFMNAGKTFRRSITGHEFFLMMKLVAKKLKLPVSMIARAEVARIDVKKDFYSPYDFGRINKMFSPTQPHLNPCAYPNTLYFYDKDKKAMADSDFVVAIYSKVVESELRIPEIVSQFGYIDGIRLEFRAQKKDYIINDLKIKKLKDCMRWSKKARQFPCLT